MKNTVGINRVTCTIPFDYPAKTTQVQRGKDVQARIDVSPNPEEKERGREYVIDRIMQHIDTTDIPHYVIGWYGYGERDDTTIPADNILQYDRDKYW